MVRVPTELPSYAIRVDGCVLPRPVGGHPALDFCDTWAGWDTEPQPGSEWLRSYAHLLAWTGFAGLLDADTVAALRGADGHKAAGALRRARAFREALYRVLRHHDADAFPTVAAEVTAANANLRLVPDGAGARFALAPSEDPLAPLRAIAVSAGELLCGPQRSRVRACPGDGCGWLFLDRGGRRTWCSMATCGNRAKVRAHAARARS